MTTADPPQPEAFPLGDHAAAMQFALSLARLSPPRSTNFAVGSVLVEEATGRVVSTGFTLELPGNTHAEECCLRKLALCGSGDTSEGGGPAVAMAVEEEAKAAALALQRGGFCAPLALYVTMEPCIRRLSGNAPCVDRVLACREWLRTVYFGFGEPGIFVSSNDGRAMLEASGIRTVHVPGFEKEIKATATAGHSVSEGPG